MEFYNNVTLVVQNHIIHEDKRSYSQRDVCGLKEVTLSFSSDTFDVL